MPDIFLLLGALALGFFTVGLISAVETALVGLPAARVQGAVEAKVQGARLLLFWLQRPGQVLGALHLLRYGATLGLGLGIAALYLMHLQAWSWVELGLAAGLGFAGLTSSYWLLRALAKRYSVEVASKSMWLVIALTVSLTPLVWPLRQLGHALARWWRIPLEHTNPFWTPDEISKLTTQAQATRLGESGEELFLSMIEFSDTLIREIMVPRTDMVTVPIQAGRSEVHKIMLEAGHSRVPVYQETIDNIIGILHVKDLFTAQIRAEMAAQVPSFVVQEMVRPTFYVPEVMKISELLRDFQRRKTHMAIVVDEYGGTAGVVTLEDIIEEIVGEIHDEYDVEEKQFRVLGDKIIADGRVSLWDLEAALQVEFPDNADYETLAGFLMSHTGSLPKTGTVIEWGEHRFVIKEANEKRVGMVEIERRKLKAKVG